MKRPLIVLSLLALTAISLLLPLQASARADIGVAITIAPPPLRHEPVPPSRIGYAWVPGFWNWDGRGHAWISGHWEIARPGYVYERSDWVRDGKMWRLRHGGWRNGGSYNGGGYNSVQVIPAPPPPRWERSPHPRHGYIWSPGHWEWQGNRHAWVTGIWIEARPGYAYAAPNWIERNGRWEMQQGHWRRHDRDHDGIPDRFDRDRDNDGIRDRNDRDHGRGSERRDSDRDGVPDRADRDRDGDGVPNYADRDRDGDGVPNRVDRRPDNPRR